MGFSLPVVVWMLGAAASAPVEHRLAADAAKKCDSCEEWNAPREPFRVFGNTYYVGVAGLSSILITSDQGSILLDGGLTQSAPLIDTNIRKLGFRTEDVRLILSSHTHYDHAGGIAALQRVSGAEVAASASGAAALEAGGPTRDDPQYAFGAKANAFPRVQGVRRVADGETLKVGPLAVTAHLTPGHTPGSTAWGWRSCEGEHCVDIVYADSLTPVSAPGFRFSGDRSRVEAFRHSIDVVDSLPCDVLLAPHPGFVGIDDKLKAREGAPARDPFLDPGACHAYAAAALERLETRLKEEAPSR